MKNAYLKNDRIYFQFDYDSTIIRDIKDAIPNRQYHPNEKQWSAPLFKPNFSLMKFVLEKHGFKTTEELFNTIYKKTDENPLLRVSTSQKHKIPSNIKLRLRDYQKEGVYRMVETKNFLNGDDMGLGKTGQAIVATEIINKWPVIVITPASVKYNWEKEWKKWTRERKVSVIESTKENDWNADVIIINYDIVGKKNKKTGKVELRFKELSKKWECLIADESQFLKNSKAIRTKAVMKLSKNIEYKYLLSGTMIMNRPVELIAQLTILGTFSDLFGNWYRYVHRYCNAHKTPFGMDVSGASNTLELHEILKESCYIRREKRDVLNDLPDKQEINLNFPITNTREYLSAESDLIEYLREISKKRAEAAQRAEHLVLLNTLRQLVVAGKLKAIEEWIQEFLESSQEKLIVIGNFKKPLETLSKKFKSELITGSVNSKDKLKIIERFQTNNKRILFGNIKSIGTGVDGLQNISSTMLFIDLPDRWTDIAQAYSRLERIGQKNKITIYYGLDETTIDGRIFKMLQGKKIITDAVNKGIVVNTNDGLLRELMKSYL